MAYNSTMIPSPSGRCRNCWKIRCGGWGLEAETPVNPCSLRAGGRAGKSGR